MNSYHIRSECRIHDSLIPRSRPSVEEKYLAIVGRVKFHNKKVREKEKQGENIRQKRRGKGRVRFKTPLLIYYFVSMSPHLFEMSTWIPVLPDNMNKYIQTHAPIYIYTQRYSVHIIYIYISSLQESLLTLYFRQPEDYEAIAQANPCSSKFRASLEGE